MSTQLKRSDIGDCQDCGASSDGVAFNGNRLAEEIICSHYTSEEGWWLRIDHRVNLVFGEPRIDKVGKLLCPPCAEIENELMKEIFDF